MSKASFILQGNSVEENHKNLINQFKGIHGNVLIATAFLRSEAILFLKDFLEQFKSTIEIYVGIRNGVTSKQGLEELLKLKIYPYIVDTGVSSFIFHPKVLLIYNDKKAISLVGSANLTTGGLVKNLEASTLLELDLEDEQDTEYVESIKTKFAQLRSEENKENVIQITSLESVEKLFEAGKLVDEDTVKRQYIGYAEKGSKVTPKMHVAIESIKKINSSKNKNRVQTEIQLKQNNITNIEWVKVWESKPLKERDLNIPTGINTHATGSMTLKKGMYDDIDQRTYFRKNVFEQLSWMNSKKGKNSHLEYATGEFNIIIEGINHGRYSLELKHDPRTNTKSYLQNNAMTHLLWKDAKEVIADRNLLGKRLELYKTSSNNQFVINIDE